MRPRTSSNIQTLVRREALSFLLLPTLVIFVYAFPCAIAVGQDVPAWPSPRLQNNSDGMRSIEAATSQTSPPVRSASAETPVVRTTRSDNDRSDNIWGSSLQSDPQQPNAQSVEQLNSEPLRMPERVAATGNGRQASVAVTNASQSNASQSNASQSNTSQSNVSLQAYSQAATGNETPTNYGNTGLALDRPQVTDASKSRSGTGTFQMLLSVGSSLLIVIGLFLGMAWAYKKTMNTSLSGMPKEAVKVLGRTGIAPRQSLMLIRFGPKLVLVSMVQGEMRTISEIDDPLQVDQIAGLCESSQPGSITNSFRNLLAAKGEAL